MILRQTQKLAKQERSASVTWQLSKTISSLQEYRKDSELNLSNLRQVNAESKIAVDNLQKANTALCGAEGAGCGAKGGLQPVASRAN